MKGFGGRGWALTRGLYNLSLNSSRKDASFGRSIFKYLDFFFPRKEFFLV